MSDEFKGLLTEMGRNIEICKFIIILEKLGLGEKRHMAYGEFYARGRY